MLAEPHARGSDLGELQRAIFKRQFEALRDGDRFFYANDPQLATIRRRYGISYRHTLAQIVRMNTAAVVPDDVFRAAG
jgi:peroxidase